MSLTSYRAAPPRAKSCVFKKEHPAEFQTGANASKNVLTRPLYRYNVARRPGSDLLSRALRQSTIGAADFHGRVRNGIGWGICAITTWSSSAMKLTIRRHASAEPCIAMRRRGGKTSKTLFEFRRCLQDRRYAAFAFAYG